MPLSLISLATNGKLNGDSMKGTNKRSAKPVNRGALQDSGTTGISVVLSRPGPLCIVVFVI